MGNRILREHGLPGEMRLPDDTSLTGDIVLSPAAIDALQQHAWPGNFRELEAVLERALTIYRDEGAALDAEAVRRGLLGPV
jgi:transcriptional regulator with PAS, ATPase and Fis domain